jgi:hypothetical protein
MTAMQQMHQAQERHVPLSASLRPFSILSFFHGELGALLLDAALRRRRER